MRKNNCSSTLSTSRLAIKVKNYHRVSLSTKFMDGQLCRFSGWYILAIASVLFTYFHRVFLHLKQTSPLRGSVEISKKKIYFDHKLLILVSLFLSFSVFKKIKPCGTRVLFLVDMCEKGITECVLCCWINARYHNTHLVKKNKRI